MKKLYVCALLVLTLTFFNVQSSYADNYSQAKQYLKRAKTAAIAEQGYDYMTKARELLEEDYAKNPTKIKTLIALSETFQLIGDRSEAKKYIIHAYNIAPADKYVQRAMGDFYYSFQEYTTALEYYKLSLATGLLKDYETNFKTAKCFEKLGDAQNAELYYKICNYINPKSREASNKLNSFDSSRHADNTEILENKKYKYLFKDKEPSKDEKKQIETDEIIEQINAMTL